MIVNFLDSKHGTCTMTIESSDDLWALRRLLAKGDVIVTKSSRVVKKEDEYSRPDKGERVKVTISLAVEEVHLDSSIERLRVRGFILEASDESVSKTGSHTVTLSPGHSMTVRKPKWGALDTKLVRPPTARGRIIIVAADRREAGVGVLVGSHLSILTSIESGLGGKMSEEQSPRQYLAKLAEVVGQEFREGDEVVVAGPGNFKNNIVNQITSSIKGASVKSLDGADVTGSDGVRAAVKTPQFQELAKDTRLVVLNQMVAEAIKRISSGEGKVAYTLARVAPAAKAGAVDACAVSDNVFSAGVDEEALVSVMNEVEEKGGEVFLADSTGEAGMQVSSFGGIVATLRYAFTP